MTAEADRGLPNETGGMLLGYLARPRRPQAVVQTVIGPGPDAHHELTRFEPDGKWQRGELARIYFESESATYLGDWHTHPEGGPNVSALDVKTARAISRRRKARAPHPLMVILYGEPEAWELAAYCYDGEDLVSLPLEHFD